MTNSEKPSNADRPWPETDPIRIAIDRGGGQACDVEGVIWALSRAGFVIVPRSLLADATDVVKTLIKDQ